MIVNLTVARAIRRAMFDPDWFCRAVLHCPNDDWQSEMMNAVADLDRIKHKKPTIYNHDGLNRFSVRSCHGPGKTHLAAKLVHWWNFTKIGVIPCTAPKEKQVLTRLFPEFRRIANRAEKEYSKLFKAETKKIVWLDNLEHTAVAESGATPENLAGYHAKALLFIVDEASGVHENMYPAVEGSLTTEGSVLFMIGNPTKTTGEFWASHKKQGTRELYYRKRVSYKDSPRVKNSWARAMIAKYGPKSPVVMSRVFGEFPDQAENQLIVLDWLEAARNATIPDFDADPILKVSVDVADGGDDQSSITVALKYDDFTVVKKQRNFSFESSKAPIKVAEAAEAMFLLYGGRKDVDEFAVDALGVGAGTAGALIKKGYRVRAHKGGKASTQPEKYRNMRAQVYYSLRDALRDGYIFFSEEFFDDEADWQELCAQLCSVKMKLGSERVDELVSKEQMRADGIKSPDRGDSLSMQYAPPAETIVEAW